ncbi:Diphthamide biosynthesis protein 2 [Orchesella cincta]|uniref:2-(3-amino-3-carboxypropyl)histidine synthase subunit 2 n=1 Tax=Orchesella cincta TaxID=48709 RepID=A0A1D2MZ85_ORCCI|nr:Diphthamide biosynthesis protein 2 [Orchesella cincta]
MSSTAITGDGRAAIEKTISVVESDIFTSITDDMLEGVFELEKCTNWVKENDFQRICLQFPDEYLTYSPKIVEYLSEQTGKRFYILADSTYGSCCVDEKTAQHVPNSDSIIHFGPSCLTVTSGRIPILYIFTRPPVNQKKLKSVFIENISPEEKVVILYDVIYQYAVDALYNEIRSSYPLVKMSTLIVPSTSKDKPDALTSAVIKHNRIIPCETNDELETCNIFFVGQRALPNLMLSMSSNTFKVYDPALTSQESVSTQTSAINKLIRKRSFYVEKIKDATSVGILVGTLVVQNYLSVIDRLKQILKKVGKKHYIVSIGEINPCKLGNFMDIECFVFVGCPEVVNYYISDESKGQFFQPILTPYDVELAFCEGANEAWGQEYVIDWSFLVAKGEPIVNKVEEDMSLITGGMRSAVINSESDSGVINWRGLTKQDELMNDPKVIYEGRSGIASSYSDEPPVKST